MGLNFNNKSAKKKIREEQLEEAILNSESFSEEQSKSITPVTKNEKEETRVVTVRVPLSLFDALDDYVSKRAKRLESKNYCLAEGIRLYLEKYDEEFVK